MPLGVVVRCSRAASMVLVVGFGGLAGCATHSSSSRGSEAAQNTPGGAGEARALTIDRTRCDGDGKRSDHEDLNHDGRADLIALYAGDGSEGALACKQADLNFDGRIDAYFHYDKDGNLEREQFDLDFDGRIDTGRYYRNGEVILDEQDTNHDGFVDTWRRYEKGQLVRMDTDRDGDGKPDMLTYFVGGRIDRIGYDVNGDGRVDQWDHDAARRARLAAQHRQLSEDPQTSSEAVQYVDEPEGGEPPKNEGPGTGENPSTPADVSGSKRPPQKAPSRATGDKPAESAGQSVPGHAGGPPDRR